MALHEFQNTPVTGLQELPAQLLMSRPLRSSLPMTAVMLKPKVSTGAKAALECRQTKQKHHYARLQNHCQRLSQILLDIQETNHGNLQ